MGKKIQGWVCSLMFPLFFNVPSFYFEVCQCVIELVRDARLCVDHQLRDDKYKADNPHRVEQAVFRCSSGGWTTTHLLGGLLLEKNPHVHAVKLN